MSFTTITSTEVEAGKPVKESLFTKVKDNFDDHESRITSNAVSLENKYADSLFNGSVAASIDGTSLKIDLVDQGGGAISTSNKVVAMFRSATATLGTYIKREVDSPISLSVPSGGTLGGSQASDRYYVYLIDYLGDPELAISSKVFSESDLVTTVAVSGSSTSTSTMYSTNARSNVACKLVGKVKATRSGSDWDSVTSVFTTTKFTTDSFSIGEIRTSMLTEAQFQTLNGSGWYLCDGGSCSNTAYAALTSNSTLPDFRGEFLRGADNGRGVDSGRSLGSTQADATDVNGMSVPSSGSHTHSVLDPYAGNNPGSQSPYFLSRSYTDPAGYGTPTANYSTSNGTHNYLGSTAHTHTLSSSDSETRPRNVAVNYFIKVDWI